MAQKESRLSSKIQRELRARYRRHIFIFKVWGNEHMMAGLPDLIGCYKGKFFGFEVKLPEYEGKVSERQIYVHGQLRDAGACVAVITSVDDAVELLNNL